MLTYSQLLAIRSSLRKASAIVDHRTNALRSGVFLVETPKYFTANPYFAGNKQLVIDTCDWETTLEEEELSEGNAASCGYFLFFRFNITVSHEP